MTSSLSAHILDLPAVNSVRVLEQGPHSLLVQVELSEYVADTWDRIVDEVDRLARDVIADTSVDLDLSIAEEP